MMADDIENLRAVWDGKIPVCFTLATDEVFTVEQPEPMFLMLHRLSYLPLVTEKVNRHFVRYVDPDNHSEMWLEDEGQPLKWHNPIGVLFDMAEAESRLPWTITVHFQRFPEDELFHCSSKEVVESYFMSMVKEADCLKHNSKIINNMQKRDHKQLWLGLQNAKFDQFWSVNRKLMEHNEGELFRHIPFRIHWGDLHFIQKLIKPVSTEGNALTLGDLLRESVPEVLPTKDGDKSSHRVVIHGCVLPLEVPLQWLSEHLSHPDNFLHICIVPA